MVKSNSPESYNEFLGGVGKLILKNLIGNICAEFRNGLSDSYFFKMTLESDCLLSKPS